MFPALLLFLVMVNQLNAPFSRLPGGLAPDLALMVAIYAGSVYGRSGAAALGFGAGLLAETLAGGLIGIGAFSKGLTALLWARLWRQIVGEGTLAQLPLVVAVTVVDGGAFFAASKLFATRGGSWNTFLSLLGWQLLSNVLLAPLLLKLFAILHRKLRRGLRARGRGHEPTLTLQPE